MAVRDTLQIGDPKLKAPNSIITDIAHASTHQLIQDLIDTMEKTNLIGIAAPQIGENYTVFITKPRGTEIRSKDQTDALHVYINPVIVAFSPAQSIIYEGCGSVCHGELFGPVQRPKEVTIEAFDETGKKFRFHCDGILARVIQHEYDHLKGIEFTEKITDYTKLLNSNFYIQTIKTSKEHREASQITKKEFSFI